MRTSCTLLTLLTLLTLSLVPLSACGDDGGGGTTTAPFEASAADDMVLTEMSPAEQTALCNELATYFHRQVSSAAMKRMSCTFSAFSMSEGDTAACNAAVQGCVDDPSISNEFEFGCDAPEVADCPITVGEIESCYSAMMSTLETTLARVSCSMDPSALQGLDQRPAQCRPIEDKCPEIFAENNDDE